MSADYTLISPSFHQDREASDTPPTSLDQCIVTIDEYDRSEQTQLKATGSSNGLELTTPVPLLKESLGDSEVAAQMPPLPADKEKHLFVSYSSEDIDEVMNIVDQLERRFNVSCIIAARDFQAGKQVIANIQDSMEISLKNVLMLTPNFVKSSFCKFERDIAFQTSIESGINSVIPVLLQECDIPKSLATVTYIDGTLTGVDIPAKIAQALIQSDENVRRPRLFRERIGLDSLRDWEMLSRYRLDRPSIEELTDILREDLKKTTFRSQSITP